MTGLRRVVVVGAGIGGVAAALALARRGAEVTVLERAAQACEVGAGLQLGPNAVKVLRALGVEAAVRRAATLPTQVILRDYRRGRQIAAMDLNPGMETRFGAPYLQVHRADLLGVLLDAARAAGVAFTFGHEVAGRDDLPPADLRPADLPPAELPQADLPQPDLPQADLIVAADGVRSALRAHVAGISDPRFTGMTAWRGLVPAAAVPDGMLPDAASVFLGPGRHLVVYPLRGRTLWNIVAVEHARTWRGEGWMLPAEPQDARAAFAGWCAPVRVLLAGLEQTFLWGMFAHAPLPRWHRDRVVLLGDACHPMLPFAAQGAAMAIEDAHVLADCTARLPLDAALAAYEALRKPRTTRVQAASARNGRVYHMATPLVRDALHAAIAARAALPGGLLSRFDWLYGADVTGGG